MEFHNLFGTVHNLKNSKSSYYLPSVSCEAVGLKLASCLFSLSLSCSATSASAPGPWPGWQVESQTGLSGYTGLFSRIGCCGSWQLDSCCCVDVGGWSQLLFVVVDRGRKLFWFYIKRTNVIFSSESSFCTYK